VAFWVTCLALDLPGHGGASPAGTLCDFVGVVPGADSAAVAAELVTAMLLAAAAAEDQEGEDTRGPYTAYALHVAQRHLLHK